MYVYIYAYIYIYIYIYVCICIGMYICIYVCVCVSIISILYLYQHLPNFILPSHTHTCAPQLGLTRGRVLQLSIRRIIASLLAFTRCFFTSRLLCTNQLSFHCPARLHFPHGYNTIAMLLRNIRPLSDPPASMPYTIQYCA